MGKTERKNITPKDTCFKITEARRLQKGKN